MNWVHCFVDVPSRLAEPTRSFWADALGGKVGEPWQEHPEFTGLEPPQGDTFVTVQVIDGPPRIHLDFPVDDVESETRRLVAAGATEGARHEDWQVLASPGGLPCCLFHESGPETRPEPVRWADGHASRLAQVCIDSPATLHEAESAFWPQATGWPLRPSDSQEFAGKCYPPDGPIRLLFQRLGPGDTATRTRAHLDLATDDVTAEVERLRDLGAAMIGPGSGWVALRDPSGLPFCVTAQSPY